MADDGYVLEYRNFDEGKNPFSWNIDRKTMTPLYMFDAAKVGAKALRAEDIGNPAKPARSSRKRTRCRSIRTPAGRRATSCPAACSAAPTPRARPPTTTRSTAPGRTAPIRWCGGASSIPGTRRDDKIMKVGGKYTVDFAVHDDNVTTRFHHVSFPLTLGIGVDADIKAVTLK